MVIGICIFIVSSIDSLFEPKTYYVSTPFNDTPHQQIFRDRFYQPVANGSNVTIARWVSDFLAGRMTQIGP